MLFTIHGLDLPVRPPLRAPRPRTLLRLGDVEPAFDAHAADPLGDLLLDEDDYR